MGLILNIYKISWNNNEIQKVFSDYLFIVELEVRDYEYDIQVIINKAFDLNYFEFSR